ncbi:MAG: hypothetical protein U5K00_14680 [Melioribacteraceae bacterium]|nr:hypothetical protein [Melioribacteraceae bacterium]
MKIASQKLNPNASTEEVKKLLSSSRKKIFTLPSSVKEIVKFYYNHIYKEKPPQYIPNKIDNVTQTSLFGLLRNTRKTAALIFVSTLLFFLPIDLFSQSNNPKTY